MKAIIAQDVGGPAILTTNRTTPTLRPSYILVKPHAVALNPADNLYITYRMAGPNSLLGCDYAGTVLSVGPEVTKTLKPGDRVFGCTRAGDPDKIENGTFAETICVKGDLAVKIPDGMGFEEASTMGVTSLTTGICLYRKLSIPYPQNIDGERVEKVGKGKVLFVYGGSSAMGTMVLQFAKLSGFQVWTVCSPKNFDLVKAYGADAVWDYNDPLATHEIKQAAKGYGGIKYCVDCISTPPTSTFCAKILASGATYSVLSPLTQLSDNDVTTVMTVGYSFLGEKWKNFLGAWEEPNMDDFDKAAEFANITENLLMAGKIKGHPVDLREGLESVIEGLGELERGEVSGKKIVARLA